MSLTINISNEVEEALRKEWGDLEKAATEALLIESYRTGKISLGYLAEILGVSRWEAETWLGQRGVTWNFGPDDFAADGTAVEKHFTSES